MSERTNKTELVKWGISILCTILILLIPTNDVFTPQIRNYIAITLGIVCIVAFSLLDFVFPAILLSSLDKGKQKTNNIMGCQPYVKHRFR